MMKCLAADPKMQRCKRWDSSRQASAGAASDQPGSEATPANPDSTQAAPSTTPSAVPSAPPSADASGAVATGGPIFEGRHEENMVFVRLRTDKKLEDGRRTQLLSLFEKLPDRRGPVQRCQIKISDMSLEDQSKARE
eukprot:9806791-Alexandrium_andersonii.AAC.1